MYPAKLGFVIGFHGCDASLVNRLVNVETTLKDSKNQYDWLGDGIYFWDKERRKSNDLPEYDSVRCAFIEGESLYENAGFHEKNHIQICIRNPNCIKGYFIPRKSNKKWPIP